MPALRIHLFGDLRLSRGGNALPAFPTQKSRGLFAFLVLNRSRRHSRDVLMGRFWGDSPQEVARKNLRNDLWRIRSVVEPDGVERGTCLSVQGDEVAFNATEAYWLDIHEFESRLDAAGPDAPGPLADESLAHLRGALSLYRGDLLEGVYDDWCLFERERLRLRYLTAVERLMRHHHARGEWAESAEHGQRLLAHDPLREHVHRDVMRCYAQLGDPAAALRQFSHCERLLRHELDAEPARETVALRDEIRTGGMKEGQYEPTNVRECAAAPVADVLARLNQAAEWLDQTGEQVRRIIRELEAASSIRGRRC